MNEHFCIACEKNLDIDNFYFNKTKNKLYNKCKLCIKKNKKDKQKETLEESKIEPSNAIEL